MESLKIPLISKKVSEPYEKIKIPERNEIWGKVRQLNADFNVKVKCLGLRN